MAAEVNGWPWRCVMSGAGGMTTSPDPFTAHERTWRHKIVCLLRGRWNGKMRGVR